jgi:hypothetical protein
MDKLLEEVRTFDNELLRSLLKEIDHIGRQDAPRLAKKSKTLVNLFEHEKQGHSTWYGQFVNIQTVISNEILYRVRMDRW